MSPAVSTEAQSGSWFDRESGRVRRVAKRFLLLTIVLIGALCGILAVLFHRFTEAARGLMIGRALTASEPWRSVFIVITPAIIFALLAWCIRRLAPRAVGANLARVRIAYNSNPEALGWRSIVATFLATP
ncbi:MAG TPA: hypothetical protein VHX14_24805, partial [Thermoanaerobaculia bacterium]|nr:hypothetical protein [Thermoanaerobaculia bacterium]